MQGDHDGMLIYAYPAGATPVYEVRGRLIYPRGAARPAFEIDRGRVFRPGTRAEAVYTIVGDKLYHRLLRVPMYRMRTPTAPVTEPGA